MQPQEIEVWYVLPAIRRELSRLLINRFKWSQKKVADLFHVSKACVSNYINNKRAKQVKFDNKMFVELCKSAEKLANHKSCLTKEVQNICNIFRESLYLCNLHKKVDNSHVCDNCNVCFVRF